MHRSERRPRAGFVLEEWLLLARPQMRKLPRMRFSVSAMAALLLLAGITVVLQSVSALTVSVTPNTTSVTTTGSVTVNMTVKFDSNEFIPVLFMRLIVEGPNPPAPIKLDLRWDVNGDTVTNGGCTGFQATLMSVGLGSIAGYGYSGSGTFLGKHTGYGYDSGNGFGAAGYGGGPGGTTHPTGSNPAAPNSNVFAGYSPATGQGYGFAAGQGTLIYTLTIPGSCLPVGSYRLTGEVATDYWSFQSGLATVTVSTGGGGGGGGSAASGTGAGQTQTITASIATAPAGATSSYQATIATASAGNTVVVKTGDATYPSVTFVMSAAVANGIVTITSWPASHAPSDAPALPSGVTTSGYLQITVTNADGKVQKATIALSIPQADVPDATKGAILRAVNGQWVPQNRLTLTLSNGRYTGSVETACCSTFSFIFDTQPPQVALAVPGGSVGGTQQITATATDNFDLTKVEFFVDGVLKSTGATAPFAFSLDTTTLSNGDHTVKAVAHDFVENTAESSKTITVQNAAPPSGTSTPTPSASPGGPGKGATGISPWVWLLIVVVVVALIVGVVVMSSKKPPTGRKP